MFRPFPAPAAVAMLLLCLLGLHANAAGLDARLDRTKVAEGEAVLLSLRAEGQGNGGPDLAPLARDFDILNRGHSSSFQVINGRSSSSSEWRITLMPKRLGELEIPALRMGKAASRALTLEVVPAAQAAASGEAPPVVVEVEAAPTQPYVQAQVSYTVRVLSRVPLRQPQLSAPDVQEAIVERLGEDKEYETYRDGHNYRVLERRYAIFPQRSGELQIAAPLLSARIVESGKASNGIRQHLFGGRDPFARFDGLLIGDPLAAPGSGGQTRPIRLRGRQISLEVSPQPAGTATPWLPAEEIGLEEHWAPDPPVFRVGEPVTRSIAISARGVAGSQLPDLPLQPQPGVSIYPDKPQIMSRAESGSLLARKLVKAAIVPSMTGTLTLPAIALEWFDTKLGQVRVARLPAREIEVLPGTANGDMPLAGSPTTPDEQSARGYGARGLPAETARAGAQPVTGDDDWWRWIALLFLAAWLLSTVMWWRARSTPGAVPVAPVRKTDVAAVDLRTALRDVERACGDNDARGARQSLLDWAAARWPEDPPGRLEVMVARLPDAARAPLIGLDRALYADQGGVWQGEQSWRQLSPLLKAAVRDAARRNDVTGLPPLYPGGA